MSAAIKLYGAIYSHIVAGNFQFSQILKNWG